MIVMKFGGSSVADAERIRSVAEIVRERAARRPVVVLSALGGVTDLLETAIAAAAAGDRDRVERVLAELERRHRWAVSGGVHDPAERHRLTLEVDRLFDELKQLLRSVRLLGEVTPRAADTLLAFGESLSTTIAQGIFCQNGLAAVVVDPSSVLCTDAGFGAAAPDVDRTAARCREQLVPEIEAGRIPLVGGFVGASPDGETTTLGRGGSDTSAAVLGSAMGAEEIQIWTDVDGLMTADPRRVPAARTLERLSFAEAAQLAFHGARVLHPASIAPAVERSIPVCVMNSLRPEGRGTRILSSVPDAERTAGLALASRTGVRLVRVGSRRMRVDPDFVSRVLAALRTRGIVPELAVSSGVAVSVATTSPVGSGPLLPELDGEATTDVCEGRAVVCAVGAGLGVTERAGEIAAELARFRPDLLAHGASPIAVVAVLAESALDPALRGLHRRFVEQAVAT